MNKKERKQLNKKLMHAIEWAEIVSYSVKSDGFALTCDAAISVIEEAKAMFKPHYKETEKG